MAMKNPPHPGRLLRADIEGLGISVSDAAERLGVTRQHLHNVLNGRSGITPSMAIRLEMGIGSGASTWLHLQGAYDLAQTRANSPDIRVTRILPRNASV